MSRLPSLTLAAVAFLIASPAYAHIALDYPTARATAQKASPCGPAGSVRGDVVTELVAGETVTVIWRETVNHPGHFRISFDDDGQDDFVEPASFTDFYTGPSVLYDDIADSNGGMNTFDITVPDTLCDNCTLQVVQVMTDKAPYGDGNDLYYQCADIRIVAGGGDVGVADMGGEDMGEADMATSTNNSTNNTTNNSTNNSVNNTTNNSTNGGTTNNPTNNNTSTDDDGCTTAAGSGFAAMGLLLVGLFFRRRSR